MCLWGRKQSKGVSFSVLDLSGEGKDRAISALKIKGLNYFDYNPHSVSTLNNFSHTGRHDLDNYEGNCNVLNQWFLKQILLLITFFL